MNGRLTILKTFCPDFFTLRTFVKSTIKFDFLSLSRASTEIYHIAYNVDESFVVTMGTSIISILDNNPHVKIIFHIFTDGMSEKNISCIKLMAKQWNCCCIIYTYNMKAFQDFHLSVNRFNRITYGRIYMPKALKGMTQRVLYFDADAICIASLKPLWHVDLNGMAIGAVSEVSETVKHRAAFLKLKNGTYFNDGIMVIDIEKWEHQHITERAFSYQNEPKERFLGQSQDILNLVMDGNVMLLSSKYNVYGGGFAYLNRDDAVIVHWTGRRKPWQMVLTKFDQQWRHYNALSPWETITNILPVKKPENYHDFQQWGKYQKRNGHMSGYLKGMFWYSWLRIRYKMGL